MDTFMVVSYLLQQIIRLVRSSFVSLSGVMAWSLGFFLLALCVGPAAEAFEGLNWIWLTFLVLSVFRYLRLIINLVAYVTLRGKPIAHIPTFTTDDVSVVVPTVFADPVELINCLRRILACGPAQLIVVTSFDKLADVKNLCFEQNLAKVEVIGVTKFNKRVQMTTALEQCVTGKIVCFADDDVFWPSERFIDIMLACFEDPKVGAAGPSQRVRRDPSPNLWNFLGICYLERRNFNTGATNRIDGAVSTLSGRTSFYRASIIQNEEFYDFFLNAINHDDDKNLTRWVFDSDWQIVLQFDEGACIETTLKTDREGFLGQCMRWARGHWRGNFRVMSTTTYWYKKHIWSLYAIYIGQFQTPAFLWDGMLFGLLYAAVRPFETSIQSLVLSGFALWILFTKIVKIIPHFCRHPSDMVFIPAMITFSYLHGFMNVYALITMENKNWGSQAIPVEPMVEIVTGNEDADVLKPLLDESDTDTLVEPDA